MRKPTSNQLQSFSIFCLVLSYMIQSYTIGVERRTNRELVKRLTTIESEFNEAKQRYEVALADLKRQ